MQDSESTLCVAMIVRDAAEAVRETLDSVRDADQRLVVDTGSRDETPQVVEECGATLVRHTWSDDFSAARNVAQQQIEADWILWLDAGEQLGPEEFAQLLEFVRSLADVSKAYAMLVQVPPTSAEGSIEQIARLRLIPGRRDLVYQGRVRESLKESLIASALSVEGLPYRIRRGSREMSASVRDQRARRNLHLAELEILQHGTTADLLNCLGDAMQTLGEHQRSHACYRKALEVAERGSSEMLEAYYGVLTSLDAFSEGCTEQLQVVAAATEVFPLDGQLLCALGGYLRATGQAGLAERAYFTAFQYGQIDPAVWHLAETRDIAAICYCLELQQRGELEPSRQILEESLRANPDSDRVRRHLIELLIKTGERDAALKQVEQLRTGNELQPVLRMAVRGAVFAAQSNWEPARSHLEASYESGCRDPLCLRWLAVTLLAAREFRFAGEVVQKWRAAEPRNLEALRCETWLRQQGTLPKESRIDPPAGNPIPPLNLRGIHNPATTQRGE